MILTAHEIMRQMDMGRIEIDPFNPEHLNPNSYDITLAPMMKSYDPTGGFWWQTRPIVMDSANPPPVYDHPHNNGKFTLVPGTLYLGYTNERTRTDKFVPIIEGKSTIARLGVLIHFTAGYGDLGFNGGWTLEISVMYPTFLYVGMRIGQIAYFMKRGKIDRLYAGKYQNQSGPTPSIAYAKE